MQDVTRTQTILSAALTTFSKLRDLGRVTDEVEAAVYEAERRHNAARVAAGYRPIPPLVLNRTRPRDPLAGFTILNRDDPRERLTCDPEAGCGADVTRAEAYEIRDAAGTYFVCPACFRENFLTPKSGESEKES